MKKKGENMVQCPNCGAINKDRNKFCVTCGYHLIQVENKYDFNNEVNNNMENSTIENNTSNETIIEESSKDDINIETTPKENVLKDSDNIKFEPGEYEQGVLDYLKDLNTSLIEFNDNQKKILERLSELEEKIDIIVKTNKSEGEKIRDQMIRFH